MTPARDASGAGPFGPDPVSALRAALEAAAEPDRVEAMAAYMKDQFVFLGVTAAERRKASKPILLAARAADAGDLLAFAEGCWAEPERELQYVAVDALRTGAGVLGTEDLDRVRVLIETKSWWDTVDSLAAWTVGPMVTNHPSLAMVMDRWIDHANIWLARTAILHQLGYKDRTDAGRLFSYADRRAGDTDFFIRKALGWALRQYARQNPDAVKDYVQRNSDRLSGLTKREALRRVPA